MKILFTEKEKKFFSAGIKILFWVAHCFVIGSLGSLLNDKSLVAFWLLMAWAGLSGIIILFLMFPEKKE